jgi:energy-coupling factor transporter ATP-binding protein EcfA2
MIMLQPSTLTETKDKPCSDLSAEEDKRLTIGVEVVANPAILFLDEPTASLDPSAKREIEALIERIAELAQVPVIPAVIDGLWGSIYSFAGNRYLWKSQSSCLSFY